MQTDDRADEIVNLLVRVYEIHESSLVKLVELYITDFEKAEALFHSLIKSHPFMNGTKRTAFAAALFFLERSGHSIPGSISTQRCY
jgi:death-on-curing family protein